MTLINFDEIDATSHNVLLTNYAGFTWTNFYVANFSVYNSSPNIIIANNQAIPNQYSMQSSIIASGPFTLNSFYIASNGDQNIIITAYDQNNNVIHTQTINSTNTPTQCTFNNWRNISKITFDGPNRNFGLDDLVIDDILIISSSNPITISKTKQTIDPNITIHSLKVGSTYKLNPTSSIGQNYFLYKSSDDKIATIDRSGLIKAISPGKFNIQIYQPGTNLIEPCNYFLPWFVKVY